MNISRFCREDQLIFRLCTQHQDKTDLTEFLHQQSINWDYFIQTVRQHRVGALVFDSLLRLPLTEAQRNKLQMLGRQEILAVIHDNRVFKKELTILMDKLGSKNIDCLLLKGLSLNYSQLRAMGDLDLMVKDNDLMDAIDSVLEIDGCFYRRHSKSRFSTYMTYQRRLPGKEKQRIHHQIGQHNEFQVIDPGRRILIEFHVRPFQLTSTFNKYVENLEPFIHNTSVFWQEKEYNENLGCYTLSRVHSLLLMCLQNGIKRTPSNNHFRLSILVDIHYLVETGISWRLLLEDSERLQIAPFVYFTLDLSKRLLGTSIPRFVLRDLAAHCTKRQLYVINIQRRCLSSLRSRHIIYSKLYNMLSPFAFGGTIKEQLSWFLLLPVWLPSRQKIGVVFEMRRNSPWIPLGALLNPLRWFYQLIEKLLAG
jgi:hypothetical protein